MSEQRTTTPKGEVLIPTRAIRVSVVDIGCLACACAPEGMTADRAVVAGIYVGSATANLALCERHNAMLVSVATMMGCSFEPVQ